MLLSRKTRMRSQRTVICRLKVTQFAHLALAASETTDSIALGRANGFG